MRVAKEHQTEEYLLPLVAAAKQGDQKAMEEITRVMRPLVVSIARKYQHGSAAKYGRDGHGQYSAEQRDEILQSAWLGLYEAISRFSPDHPAGKTFWLVSYYRILHEVREWVARNSGGISMPRTSGWQLAPKIDSALEDAGILFWDSMTAEELANITGIKHARRILEARQRSMPMYEEDQPMSFDSPEALVIEGFNGLMEQELVTFVDTLDLLPEEEWLDAAEDFCRDWDLPETLAPRIVEVAHL